MIETSRKLVDERKEFVGWDVYEWVNDFRVELVIGEMAHPKRSKSDERVVELVRNEQGLGEHDDSAPKKDLLKCGMLFDLLDIRIPFLRDFDEIPAFLLRTGGTRAGRRMSDFLDLSVLTITIQ